jgi:DNA-binding transcriptional ArsR family regulator
MPNIDRQLDALGDPTRRAILAHLIARPLPVGELSAHFPISRPAISQHLRILKAAHLVFDSAVGTRRVYAIDQEGFAGLREYFDQFWGSALLSFKSRLENPSS